MPADWAGGFAGVELCIHDMMDASPVAMYTTDTEGFLTYFNNAATLLAGRRPEIGVDRWCVTWKLFRPDGAFLRHEECPMAILLQCGELPGEQELLAERPDGTRCWLAAHPSLLRDKSGRVIGGLNILIDITAQKTAQRESENHFRSLFDAIPACVKLIAADGTLLQINAWGLAMVGATHPDALVGRSAYDLIAPEDRSRFEEFHKRVCAGEEGSLKFDVVDSQGVRHHLESHSTPFKMESGATAHLAVTQDIAAQRISEITDSLLSAIVDSSDDAIVSKDLNGIITSWNKGAERLFGYSAHEVIGKPVTILIPADRQEEEPNILKRLRRGDRVDHFETIRRRKDGTLLDISLTISPVRDAQGTIVGASKIARDVTERKRAEKALHASQMRFRQLAESMPQMVWTASPDGQVDYYNERWYEFTGFPRDTFGDDSWQPLLHPEDVDRCREAWSRSVGSGTPYSIEYRFWDRSEQRWRWFMGRALPARDSDGEIAKWFGTCTDIDDQKRVEDDLRRANQDLEQFAFSASHDLQEPLRTVSIYSELLTERYGDQLDEQAVQYLGFLRQGASRMEALIRDLLTYTRVTTLADTAETTDANVALKTVLDSLTGAISEAGAAITSDPLPAVQMPGPHLQQIFQNLIGNSLKYRSPERRAEVHVTATRDHADWILSVRDNGIGIHPEYKEKIFGLFRRLHTSDEYPGTGIGLAICQRIVARYHGRIWVESQPGQGSTFRFTIPF